MPVPQFTQNSKKKNVVTNNEEKLGLHISMALVVNGGGDPPPKRRAKTVFVYINIYAAYAMLPFLPSFFLPSHLNCIVSL